MSHRLRLATGLAVLAIAASALAQPRPESAALSEQERLRELNLLGLAATRPGVQNRDPASPDHANYDEATIWGRRNLHHCAAVAARRPSGRASGSGSGTGLAVASS